MNDQGREPEILLACYDKMAQIEVRLAFFALFTRLSNETALSIRPYRHGRQFGIHLLFDPNGPVTGKLANGAQFAFDTAQAHLTWWFRPPCLNYALLTLEEIGARFENAHQRPDSHITIRLHNQRDVDLLLPLLILAQSRYALSSPI